MAQNENADNDATVMVQKAGSISSNEGSTHQPASSGPEQAPSTAPSAYSPPTPASQAAVANPGTPPPTPPVFTPHPSQDISTQYKLISDEPLAGLGLNPIVRAASRLINVVMPLRTMASYADLEDLRQQLVLEIRNFEHTLRSQKFDTEHIAAARYVLCTFLDETIASTPWGGDGAWATKSMLVYFHKETWGGEKVFTILQQLGRDPRKNINILELFYLCLSLGMQGRYGVREGGRDKLENLRGRLYQMIQAQRGDYPDELSPYWHGLAGRRKTLWGFLPLWVILALLGTIMVLSQLYLNFSLTRIANPMKAALADINLYQPSPPKARPEAPLVKVTPVKKILPKRFIDLLAEDIDNGLITVRESAEGTSIFISAGRLFDSASDQIRSETAPLITRLGNALKEFPGHVAVAGHTDNVPIMIRYPSNQELSLARAKSVKKVLAGIAGPESRYSVIGRGDTEPVADNSTAEGRAINRRIQLIFYPGSPATLSNNNQDEN